MSLRMLHHYIWLWLSFIVSATSSEAVSLQFVKGVTRLNLQNYHDYYFSCHSVGLYLQWQYNTEFLRVFYKNDTVGFSTVSEASGFTYTTTLLSSIPDQDNSRAMDSILVVSFIGDYPSNFTVSCSNGPHTRTISAGSITEVGDSSRYYNNSFNDRLLLDYIGSGHIVNNQTTHLFICGAQHSSHLLQANGPPILVSSSDKVGFSRSPTPSTHTVDVQGIFIARIPFITTSLLIVVDESDLYVTCFYDNLQARVPARPRVTASAPTEGADTRTTVPAAELKTTVKQVTTTLAPATTITTTTEHIGVVSESKSVSIIVASLVLFIALCVVTAFLALIIYLKKCRTRKVKLAADETEAKQDGLANLRSECKSEYFTKEKTEEPILKIYKEEVCLIQKEHSIEVGPVQKQDNTDEVGPAQKEHSIYEAVSKLSNMQMSKTESTCSVSTASMAMSNSDLMDSNSANTSTDYTTMNNSGSAGFPTITKIFIDHPTSSDSGSTEHSKENGEDSKQYDALNEVDEMDDQERIISLRRRYEVSRHLEGVCNAFLGDPQSYLREMELKHLKETNILSIFQKNVRFKWSHGRRSSTLFFWKLPLRDKVHQVQDGGAQFATLSSGKLKKTVYVKKDGQSFDIPVKLKENGDTSRNAPKKFSYLSLSFKELLHSISSSYWAIVKNFEIQMEEYFAHEMPLLAHLRNGDQPARKNAKIARPVTPEENLNKACVLTPRKVVGTDKLRLYRPN